MRSSFRTLALCMGALTVMASAASPAKADENTLTLTLSTGGPVVVQLMPDVAPKHVERIKTLTKEGFYNGVKFHRVIDGFMAQTGDPTGTGTGGSNYSDLPAEFSQTEYKRGTVGMARGPSADSANSQFFICFTDDGCSFLKGQYTVFGQVTSGMEFVDKVARGEPPATPDTIVKAEIEPAAAPAVTPAAPPAK